MGIKFIREVPDAIKLTALTEVVGTLKRAELDGTGLTMMLDGQEVRFNNKRQSTFTFYMLRAGDFVGCEAYQTQKGWWRIPAGGGIYFPLAEADGIDIEVRRSHAEEETAKRVG